METNFSFIPSEWSALAIAPQEAEKHVYGAPLYCAMLCRKNLEEWIRWLFENDPDLVLPYDKSLNSLIHDPGFQKLVSIDEFKQLNLIRKLGNTAVHSNAKIKTEEALFSLHLLHGFIKWVVQLYSKEKIEINPFNEKIIPRESASDKSKSELIRLEAIYHEQQTKLVKLQDELAIIKAIKDQNTAFVLPPINPNESLTRKIYIDTMLREAGWDPFGENVNEYEVKNCMPSDDGGNNADGRADYVLWGDDGKPLAVVEAKRTKVNKKQGRQQAKCYADCLEKYFGQRPIIYFTNGYEIWMWDDLSYPDRKVYGYYTKDELQLLIQRRTSKLPLATQPINKDITDRYYQKEAIRKVTEALEAKRREALLVMATGTGKTRVAASIIDLLSKANWIKRVLFLADRNALVHQAKSNLNVYLPNLPAVDLTKEKEDESSRIVFSTYQTIINMIDSEADGNNRFYGVGHFDLIIFDEIHRSVYNTYKHIFKYFDGYRIGLTATPRTETDRDTYDLFNLEPNNPTYAYELDQAVKDKFLVPHKEISVTTKFQRQGIKYADLSPEEKKKYEEEFADPITGEFPDEIDSAALNKWLFNIDTVDKVIGHLMENGIKVEGGDKLAKTIIFARSHEHAIFIEERFNIQYPHYRGEFMSVIVHSEKFKYDLLNKFREKTKLPQIAVSVDMLDTGIDVPEICNLVFFKPVRSRIKFWQMIGRGTRLCPDLFAIGKDKKEFVIFDHCENFKFFNINPNGFESKSTKSISQRLFELRLRLAFVLLNESDTESKEYGQAIINQLIQQTQELNNEGFIVRQHLKVVEKFQDPNSWNALSDLDVKEIFDNIAPLISETEQDEFAKRFDIMMLDLQMSILNNDTKQVNIIQKIINLAGKLSKKASIPAVAKKMDVIKIIQDKNYWESITVPAIERLRVGIRELIKFLDIESTPIVYTNFEDEFQEGFAGNSADDEGIYGTGTYEVYKRKVEQYINEQSNNITIHKLKNNIPITKSELNELERMLFEQGSVVSKEQFTEIFGQQPLGKFVRSIIGLDTNVAKQVFSELLNTELYNSQQIRFIDTIINFLSVKGTIDPAMLFEAPFTDLNTSGVAGLFDQDTSSKIIELIEKINHNAEVA